MNENKKTSGTSDRKLDVGPLYDDIDMLLKRSKEYGLNAVDLHAIRELAISIVMLEAAALIRSEKDR